MTDFDRINSRLDSIEKMLRQLLSQNSGTVPVGPTSDLFTEIAQVRAAGGDLATHFKEKARRTMRQDAAEKKRRRSRKSDSQGDWR